MDMTDQPTIPFDPQETLEAPRYELHGESGSGIGMLQSDIVAWSFEGQIWWMTGAEGSVTGYSFEHFHWLSVRKQVL